MTDDIRDLLGRYATGSLTAEEHKRLFDAALDDQELFEELAREDEMKELFAGPGVRDRLIRALEPPKRRVPWVLALAPVAVLSALLIVVLMRPVPKPQQLAVATVPASPAPAENTRSEPPPTGVPAPVLKKAVDQPRKDAPKVKAEEATAENVVKKDAESRPADQKVMDQAATAAPAAAPPPAPQTKTAGMAVEVQAQSSQVQQNAPGGPKQNAVDNARAMAPVARSAGRLALIAPGFGFHYSVQTAGHLVVIPSADGYLSVKSGVGAVLFSEQRIAAGIVTDIVVPGSVRSMSIVFSAEASPGPVAASVRTAPEGTVQAAAGGPAVVAVELGIKPK